MAEQPQAPFEFERLDPEEMAERAQAFRDTMGRRRSVRDFAPDPVPHEVIKNAIAAAGSAPSGANLQPWHFVVVTDSELKRSIRAGAEDVEREFYERRISDEWREALEPLDLDVSKPFLEEAPALIVVYRRNHVIDEAGERHKTYYPTESVGIATGVLISALHQAGVAMVPYTPSPMTFLRELIERPEDDYPFLILAIGYPGEGVTVPDLGREPTERISTFIGP